MPSPPVKELQEQVAEAIRPIVLGTYGSGSMPKALVDHLAEKIAAWPKLDSRAVGGELMLNEEPSDG